MVGVSTSKDETRLDGGWEWSSGQETDELGWRCREQKLVEARPDIAPTSQAEARSSSTAMVLHMQG